jgi:hypothetical protein
MKRVYIILIVVFLLIQVRAISQGCVAIRSNGTTCNLIKPGAAKEWQFNFNTRYFKSYKHFVGKEEQKQREEEGTYVINHSFAWDFTFAKALNNPGQSHSMSRYFQMCDPRCMSIMAITAQAGSQRNTESFGIGDIRVTAYRWPFVRKSLIGGNCRQTRVLNRLQVITGTG